MPICWFLQARKLSFLYRIKLCIFICPLCKLIYNLIGKEELKYSEGVVYIKIRRKIRGAIVVEILNMQRLKGWQWPRLRGGVLLPSKSVELNIKSVEQSLYYQKYD